MKTINNFLECGLATPLNTNGIGNPMAPEGIQVGSGDIPIGTGNIRKKKRKHLKEYLKDK